MTTTKAPHAYSEDCLSCQAELKTARRWRGGRVTAMGIIKGYVMARKRGAAPVIITWREWFSLPAA